MKVEREALFLVRIPVATEAALAAAGTKEAGR